MSDTSRPEREKTGAGQEARRGVPPGDHEHEHQSNYGGGGVHGGSAGSSGGSRADAGGHDRGEHNGGAPRAAGDEEDRA